MSFRNKSNDLDFRRRSGMVRDGFLWIFHHRSSGASHVPSRGPGRDLIYMAEIEFRVFDLSPKNSGDGATAKIIRAFF